MNKKKNEKEIRKIMYIVLKKLLPLGCYVYHEAVTTSSVYLKFKNPDLKSLTIRDHKTKAKYRYKWNIIIGYSGPKIVKDNGVTRYMYNEKQLEQICSHITNYSNKITRRTM